MAGFWRSDPYRDCAIHFAHPLFNGGCEAALCKGRVFYRFLFRYICLHTNMQNVSFPIANRGKGPAVLGYFNFSACVRADEDYQVMSGYVRFEVRFKESP